jgi:hypothetical protein
VRPQGRPVISQDARPNYAPISPAPTLHLGPRPLAIGEPGRPPVRLVTIEPEEHEWTAEWLRAFLTDKGVMKPKRWDLSDEALMWLTLDIFVCVHVHSTPPQTPHPTFPGTVTKRDVERVRNGLERRRADEMIILASWRGHPDTPADPFVRTETERVSETIDRIAVALSVLDDLKLPARKPKEAWHSFAVPLARKFIRRAEECGHSFKLANNGPVARYVHAVIRLITKEEPKLGTVRKFLHSRRTEFLEG